MNMAGAGPPAGGQTPLDLAPQPDGPLVAQLGAYCRFMPTAPALTPHHINIDKDEIAPAVAGKINKFLTPNDGGPHPPDLEPQ